MSVAVCLNKLEATGRVTPDAARAARALWERYQGRFSLDMPPAQADAAAALQAARTMAQTAAEKKRSVALQTIRQTEAERVQHQHEWGPVAGAMALLTRDIYRTGTANVDTRAQTIREALFSRFNAGLEAYSSRLAGLKQDTVGPQNMVRELFGVDTGDEVAKAAAKGWQDAVSYGTEYVQKAGKIFEAAEDWRLPQAWNSDRVRRFGAQAFKADVQDAIAAGGLKVFDKERMVVATDPARIDLLLDKAARDIVTEAGSSPAFSAEKRTFLFEDGKAGADAWLALQGKYGAGQDILATLRSHLGRMAQDAALTDILGPQHAATAALLEKNARAAERLGQAGSPWRPQRWLGAETSRAVGRTYNVLSGRANGVESTALAGFFGALRSMMSGSSLGSAVIAAVPGDSLTTALAARWNGLETAAILRRIVEPGMSQEDAARLLVTGHAISDHAVSTLRYADQLAGPELLRKVADVVIRASGLTAWTEGLKRAFTLEMLGYVAKQADRAFGAVDAPFRSFLERYGVTPAEWEAIRARPLQDVGGAKFFDSAMAADDPLARKIYEGVLTERAYAVLEPDARVRSITTGGTQAGTIVGELARNLSMFTSFAQTMMLTHWMKIATESGSLGNKVMNGVAFLGLHIMAGAVILQARQVLQGRDPISMDSPRFWVAAMMSGGGLGYYGDLIGNAVESSDRSIIGKFSGPIGGLVDDTGRALPAVATKGWGGAGEVIDVVPHRTPRQKVLWARLGTDRLLSDQLHRPFAPDYAQGSARRENAAMKTYGQRFYWAPGEAAPSRMPAFGNVMGR
ncbi:hypothetical protein [Enterovirga sp.]|mgnify:FL=1|uniref:hypothetical protein n=1 Tax=Enterovirga sp. TaxID=2026350 RepID=UPI002B7599A5|nr:hypothetical protein [Enterovirga sp.]HMO30408.1 hypothetical protein [Enterovirga sp.]